MPLHYHFQRITLYHWFELNISTRNVQVSTMHILGNSYFRLYFFSISLKTFLWLNNFLVDKMCCCYIHTKHTSSCCGQILANGWLQNEQTLNCTNWFCTKYCIHSFTFFSLCWIEFIKLFLPLYLLFFFMLWMIFRQLYYSLNTNNNSQQLHTTSITLNKSALSVVIIFNKGTLF